MSDEYRVKALLKLRCGITEAAPTPQAEAMAQAGEHRYFNPVDIKWVEGPPSLPKGAKIAVLEGDLASPGPYTMRVKVAGQPHPYYRARSR